MTRRVPQGPLKVALVPMTSTDDAADNVRQMVDQLRDIPDPDLLDLAIFPESALFLRIDKESGMCGFELGEPLFRPLMDFSRAHQIDLLFGAPILEEDASIANALVRIRPGGIRPEIVYRKIHLFDVEVEGHRPVRESDYFKHGQDPRVLEIKGWRLGLSICYDLRFSELYSTYAREEVDAILIPAAFLVPTGRAHWHILLRARAIESACYVLAPAQVGEHISRHGSSRKTFGHSLLIEPWGQVAWDSEETSRPGVFELDPKKISQFAQQIPMAKHRRIKS